MLPNAVCLKNVLDRNLLSGLEMMISISEERGKPVNSKSPSVTSKLAITSVEPTFTVIKALPIGFKSSASTTTTFNAN